MIRHRAMSHLGEHGEIIEHAGSGRAISMSDEELRERCRTAPLSVRRQMDARREARGMPPLWGGRGGADGRSSPRKIGALVVARMRSYLALARARRAADDAERS